MVRGTQGREERKENRIRGGGHTLACMVREGEIEKDDLPYEKFERLGAEALSNAELLAIIVRTGGGGLTPMAIGREILKKGESAERGLAGLYHLSLDELQQIPGIGRVKAVRLKCITEFSRRMAGERTKPALSFLEPGRIAAHYMERLRHEEQERVLLISLNTRMNYLAENEICVGSADRSLFPPREIFRAALRNGAINIILLHNHPGGDPTPSEADRKITARVRDLGEMLQIRLADHLIIGDGCYYSFRESGFLR